MAIPYTIGIKQLDTGETRKVDSQCGFVNDDALKVFRERMCDCNLAGYFWRGDFKKNALPYGTWETTTEWLQNPNEPHNFAAFDWAKVNS